MYVFVATVLAASLLTAQLSQTRDLMRHYPSPALTTTPLAADEKGSRERRVGALLGGGGVVTKAVVEIWQLVESNPVSMVPSRRLLPPTNAFE